ncbi:hypothetical protein BTO05_12180 [Winogradskyella sp. PC-19]|uniref:carbohydrate-binding family 9-like protein n=1 Tax=unclassified Winogradskyella TaxID=2615021 RepID=UPI000B3CC1D7|nr:MULTISPECIES: carbohydrate-binding family 9-like protein [unclassified Winogradskyella]ARV10361.1 hypothetical protein BTO05_12180 [Winogradskyella sp. PC-19]RZN82941.1 MAG: carbohydrate-binding family 9-like protein [Winogradskyella sp.]
MKLILLFTTFLFFTSCKQKQQDVKDYISVDISEDIVIPKHYIVTKTNAQIKIDGLADEISWENASYTSSFIDIEGVKTPKYKTQAKMLWDENFLYVYAKMEEPHIWGDITKRDAIIYLNNDFEVFIDPSKTGYGYGEVEINALNTVWDLFLDKPYRVGGKANFHWDLKNLKSAVFIDGTLNDPNDHDKYWALEIAIPLKPLINLKNRPKTTPKEGEQWRLNFSRVEWDFNIVNNTYQRKKVDNKLQKEYNWVWSNQKVINMHEPEKWGFIQFTTQENTNNVEFIEDKDLLIKQTAYALFRKTRYQDLKYLLDKPVNSELSLDVQYSKKEVLKATFLKTNFGFEYKIKSPLKENYFIINEQGILKQL